MNQPKKTGASRMQQLGKRPSQLWLKPDDYALIAQAAKIDGRPLAQFCRLAAVDAARKLLKGG